MTEEQRLEAIVTIGSEAKKFIESDLGRYVLGCAQQEIEEFTEKLKDAETPLTQVEHLRTEINRRELAVQWIAEVIQEADNAYAQLEVANTEDN